VSEFLEFYIVIILGIRRAGHACMLSLQSNISLLERVPKIVVVSALIVSWILFLPKVAKCT
jgi:hypothetical protein